MTTPWTGHALSTELETALAAVRTAGLLCREVQASLDPGALEKKDRSPVTVADFGSQALVCKALGEAFPADPVIGEENSAALRDPANAATLERVTDLVRARVTDATTDDICTWIDRGAHKEAVPRLWTLDPIDGTKGFLRGQQYAVGLALVLDGEIVLSALACPNLGPALDGDRGAGTVMLAIRGAGAWQVPMDGEAAAVPLRVSGEADPALIRFCESVEKAHSSHDAAARIAERLAIRAEPVRLDSMTKYAVVARGEAEAYLRLPRSAEYREKIWDHAGGVLVLTEAGGRVTDVLGRDLDFSHGYRLEENLGVIVSNGRVHEAILAALEELEIGRF
ncbi:MAG: 3'(2'),5'-bisphosphate nucleotidase [bacterium]|nr:3'(2'),5'-bisphosphate nucleotidase [bacterium]